MWREAFPQRLVGMKKTVPEGTRAFLYQHIFLVGGYICNVLMCLLITASDTSSHLSIWKAQNTYIPGGRHSNFLYLSTGI